jgi:hypothetical protein
VTVDSDRLALSARVGRLSDRFGREADAWRDPDLVLVCRLAQITLTRAELPILRRLDLDLDAITAAVVRLERRAGVLEGHRRLINTLTRSRPKPRP